MEQDLKMKTGVQQLVQDVAARMPNQPRAVEMFERCMRNTLDTTIRTMPDATTFVITGDIPAMWLRDSAAQVRPFLLVAAEDDEISEMIRGLVERQFRYILYDPYANAFNETDNGCGHQTDLTAMKPGIWERKYEVDSLCYPIQLSYLLWKNGGRVDQFNETFIQGVRSILALWRTEQHHETLSPYRFQRMDGAPSDTLLREGKGTLTGYTGMTWSGFRPSDDACHYGYLIPSNMFAVVVLGYLAEIASEILKDSQLEEEALALRTEIRAGIEQHGKVIHAEYGEMYAYETDGLGGTLLMDDANVPSLLAMPYLGYGSQDDPVYMNTRNFLLSQENPYYYKGTAAEGIGSPHTPEHYIWPIALAIQGLTAQTRDEKERMLELMLNTDAGKGMMHEGFHKDNPMLYTREWFSWANMMFCELVLDLCGMRVQI